MWYVGRLMKNFIPYKNTISYCIISYDWFRRFLGLESWSTNNFYKCDVFKNKCVIVLNKNVNYILQLTKKRLVVDELENFTCAIELKLIIKRQIVILCVFTKCFITSTITTENIKMWWAHWESLTGKQALGLYCYKRRNWAFVLF